MHDVSFGNVYLKIEEISRCNFSRDTPIHIDRLVASLNIDYSLVHSCLMALHVLEQINFVDDSKQVFVLK